MLSIRTHTAVLLVLVSLYRYLHSDVYPTPRPTHWTERASCMVPVPRITRQYATLGRLQKTKSSDGEWVRLLLLLAGDIERNPGPDIDQQPSLPELINFQAKTRTIYIPSEIGTQYFPVGIVLLDDKNGEKVASIHHKCLGDLPATNLEILRCWMRGDGIYDRTWGGLLAVLRPHCGSLAAEIAEALGVEESFHSWAVSDSEPLPFTQTRLHSRQFYEYHPHPSITPPAKRHKVLALTSPAQSPLPAQQQAGKSATGGNAKITGGSATGGGTAGGGATGGSATGGSAAEVSAVGGNATGGNAKATGWNATVYSIHNVTATGGKVTGRRTTGDGATGVKSVDKTLHSTPPSQYQFAERDSLQPPRESQFPLPTQQLAPSPTPVIRSSPPPSQLQQIAHPTMPQVSKLTIFLNYLKSIYLQELPEGLKWPPTPTKKFINLAIIGKENIHREEQEKFKTAAIRGDIDDIFDYTSPISKEAIFDVEEGKRLQCVLVEGVPGVGKSTLAWEICQQWAKGALYQQYEMVLLLRLRDETVQNAETIEDLILYEDDSYQRDISEHIYCASGKNLLIILEGLDELPNNLFTECSESIFIKLISGKVLPLATILITSRPSATAQLHQKLYGKISRHIEVLGFTKKQINQYIYSVLSDEELTDFTSYISMAPSIQRLMYIPLHSAIVVLLYRAYRKKCNPLPTNLTGLYKCLAQTILQRHLDCHPKYKDDEDYMDIEDFKDLPTDIRDVFDELALLAYNGVKEQMLIFKDQPRAIEHLGFMNKTPELFPNCRAVKYSINFLHVSVQEYLAAYYISQKGTHEQEQLLESIRTEKHLQNTGRFLAGITKFKGVDQDKVKHAVLRVSEFPCSEVSTYGLHLMYESETASILNCNSYCEYKLPVNSPLFDWIALGYCIACTNCKWRLELNPFIVHNVKYKRPRVWNATEGVQLLLQELKDSSTCKIDSIKCSYNETEFIQKLLMGLPQHTLAWITTLTLNSLPQCLPELIPKLTTLYELELERAEEAVLTSTFQALTRMDTLKKLEVSLQNCDACVPILAQWLTTSTQLEVLTIKNLPASGSETLSRAAPLSLSLKTLNLCTSQFSIPAMKAFSAMLSEAKPKVRLFDCDTDADVAKALLSNAELTSLVSPLGSKAAVAIAEALVSNSTLKCLDISYMRSRGVTAFTNIWNLIEAEGATAIGQALQSNTKLTNLDIKNNSIGDKGAAAIGQALQSNTSLTSLNIRCNSIGAVGATAICQALQSNTALTSLNISGNSIGDVGATAIGEALQSNTTLDSLDISSNSIRADGTTAICQALQNNTTLKNLDIVSNLIESKGAAAIGQALQSNTTLTDLDISSNSIGVVGATAIGEALQNNISLTGLNVTCNSIGAEGATAIVQALRSNTALTSLEMRFNLIGDKGAIAIGHALQSNTALLNLNIVNNSIGDDGATSIGQGLLSNTALTSLNISVNSIGDCGAITIGQALQSNIVLISLDISYNSIGTEGATAISQGLQSNTTLTTLNISYNYIGDKGATAIGQALQSNTALTNLDIVDNSIGPKGATFIGQGLLSNTALTDLNISMNSIGDIGVITIGQALQSNTVLTSLDISYNIIGADGATAISQALQSNTTLTGLNISYNSIGDYGAITIGRALQSNTVLTSLDISYNSVGAEGVTAIGQSLQSNTTLNRLNIMNWK